MQSGGGARSAGRVRYSYRPPSEDSEDVVDGRADSDAGDDSEDEGATVQAATASAPPPAAVLPPLPAPATGSSSGSSKVSKVLDALRDNPALVAGTAAGLAATGGLLLLLSSLGSRRKADSTHSSAGKGKAAAAAGPGPNSKVKPTATCVPLSDGSAVVVHRPIAADNSCLFNAVGYCMHHSTNRAPFLRQVVSREVSSDPQQYSAAFLGMENAAYCAWITNPAHWGGGIELAILAAHYRREIAAWNLATGACHVFGEDAGYAKRVMVIYNGVHYDALAVSPGPPGRVGQEEDATEFNPRTRRGKMIIAAAQKLVQLKRQGKEGHHEQQDKQKQQERQQRKQKKQQRQQQQPAEQQPEQAAAPQQQAESSSSKEQPKANGHAPAAAAAAAAAPPLGAVGEDSSSGGSSRVQAGAMLLGCQSCGEVLADVDAARAHAAATGHVEFAQVQ